MRNTEESKEAKKARGGKGVITVIFIISTAICAAGWIGNHDAAKAMVIYMSEKGYMLPNKEEADACTRKAVKQIFKVN